MLPLFKQSENHFAGGSEFHSNGGEWRVEQQRLHWPILDAFRDAAAQSGIANINDFNTGDNEGCGYFQVNQKAGVRWNAAKAFLKPIRQRPNLTVLTEVDVDRVVLENGRAAQVVGRQLGQSLSWKARKEIVLCAGSVGSPGILQRSGIGPSNVLKPLGIDVVRELPGVGGNLQDHLQLRLIYKLENARTLNQIAGSVWGKLGMGLQYLYDRSGPLSMAPSQLGAFARSGPEQTSANLEYHVQPLSLERFGEPLHAFPAFTASVCDLRPQSRGRVDIRSANPLQMLDRAADADRHIDPRRDPGATGTHLPVTAHKAVIHRHPRRTFGGTQCRRRPVEKRPIFNPVGSSVLFIEGI